MTSARTTKNTEEKLGARGGQFLKPDLSAKPKKNGLQRAEPPGAFLKPRFLEPGTGRICRDVLEALPTCGSESLIAL